jgi:hypothetical protein
VIEVGSATVIDGGRPWVLVTGGKLHVTQRDAAVEGRHDEAERNMWGGQFRGPLACRHSEPSGALSDGRGGCRPLDTGSRSPTARSIVLAVRGTNGMTAGLFRLPRMRSVR